ncbi:Uncharacterized protein (Fragment) [Durusdinium trenchii]|uniref:Uncharacterized protein n=1 Tax=Durusdinium trenchii TaxID=1381693 RepID=A0ABP0PXU1_9DINO
MGGAASYVSLPCADPEEVSQRSCSTQQEEEFNLAWQVSKLAMLGICAVCYVFGLTQALFIVDPPFYSGNREPPVQRSNLELISFLYQQGMPTASGAVILFAILLPILKFGMTLILLLKPKQLSKPQLSVFCQCLNVVSPYQMCDVFLVMFMLSYLNIGMSSQSGVYKCQLCQGFTSFFIYCVSSIIMAQMLQVEINDLEVHDAFSVRELSVRSTPRNLPEAVPPSDDRSLILFGGLWLVCTTFVLLVPFAPLSLQARAAGFIVYRQDPTFWELFQSLLSQSPFFACLEVTLVIVAPACSLLLALLEVRCSAFAPAARNVAKLGLQVLIMGDVAAVALCCMYLSIQDLDFR